MYETLFTAFAGLEEWQPIHHADFLAFHGELVDAYLELWCADQLAYCSRFNNQVITEAGVSKQDIDELNELGHI